MKIGAQYKRIFSILSGAFCEVSELHQGTELGLRLLAWSMTGVLNNMFSLNPMSLLDIFSSDLCLSFTFLSVVDLFFSPSCVVTFLQRVTIFSSRKV